jgi:hypothetical protein
MTNNEIEALVAKQKALEEIGKVVALLNDGVESGLAAVRVTMVWTGNELPFAEIGEREYNHQLTESLLDLFAAAYERLTDEMDEMKVCVPIADAETKTLYHVKNIL